MQNAPETDNGQRCAFLQPGLKAVVVLGPARRDYSEDMVVRVRRQFGHKPRLITIIVPGIDFHEDRACNVEPIGKLLVVRHREIFSGKRWQIVGPGIFEAIMENQVLMSIQKHVRISSVPTGKRGVLCPGKVV